MGTALVIALGNPDPTAPPSFSFEYGFPRTAALVASCVQEWGQGADLQPRLLNIDAAAREGLARSGEPDPATLHEHLIVQELERSNPELVCVVAPYTYLANWALATAKLCRRHDKGICVVTGGPHATFLAPELARLADRPFDAVILGPGEAKLKHLLEHFRKPSERFRCPGITTPEQPARFGEDAQRNDVQLPPVDFGLIAREDVGSGGAVVLTGRGCPCDCRFCVEARYWRKAAVEFAPERVRNELLGLLALGVPVLGCGDSLVDLRSRRSARLCQEAFGGLGLTEHFFVLTRLHMLDDRGCRAFREGGGRAVWVGLETASVGILKAMGKTAADDHAIKDLLGIPKQNGLKVGAFFMFGLPGETEATAEATLSLLNELFSDGLLDYADPSIFVPYPGLPMYENPQAYGLIPHEPAWKDWDAWGRYHRPPVFDLPTLSRMQIFSYWERAFALKQAMDIRDAGCNGGTL